ncbi:DsbA family protein [Patescibacteria group bacterium]|nr:DsbA family protein [Patescibacteria group bacterium]
MSENKQGVFSSHNPKISFIIGLIAGVLIIGTIGFFVLIGTITSSKSAADSQNQKPAGNQPSAQAPAPSAVSRVNIPISESDHIRGNKNAPVTIVEFSDYQCPYCARHHSTMQQVMAQYGNQVAWVYKHFPLDSIHDQARPAAEASECVGEQKGDEGFWQFTDGLFENQSSLGAGLYNQLAQVIGVDMDKFQECVSSRKYQAKVEADYQAGIKAGVTGTPGNFVNGIPVSGAAPFANFKQIIDSELSK